MINFKASFLVSIFLLTTLTENSFAMSTVSTVNRAKTTFELSQVLINEPNRIAVLKTDIDQLYSTKSNFSGLNNKVIENMSNSNWILKNTVIKTEPINSVMEGGYSINTDNASYKACKASKLYFSKNKLAVRQLLINGIENGDCKLFTKHKLTLIFD